MSEMIKRVAEAIKECDADRCADMSQFWMVHARAAIEAMREPTADMLNAGAYGSGEGSERVARGAWEFMIDAALATEPVS